MMTKHLVFALTACLASMGDVSGHERRGTLTWPGRSSIIGLLGAALGRRREDSFADLDELSVAVAVFDRGQPLRDYQTIETIPTAAVRRPNSRPQALAEGRAKRGTTTTITLHDYRTTPLYGAVVWGGELEMEILAEALREPRFTLYLGRKSCPLAAPTGPRTVMASGPREALESIRLPPWFKGAVAKTLIVDADPEDLYTETRHDVPLDRRRWHFGERRVAYRSLIRGDMF